MSSRHTLVALLTAGLMATPLAISAATLPAAAHNATSRTLASDAARDARMKAMHEMHEKMMAAKTPEERQALMADHMKAMQGGMQMMEGMSGPAAMDGKAAGGRTNAAIAKRQQMMEGRMEMMQMMMEMMMQRLPDAPSPPPAK